MNNTQVPQHNISTHTNSRKAIYAVDDNGVYTIVSSSGWNVEEQATRQALEEFERLAAIAYEQVTAGEASPLYFHMYKQRMDLKTLAGSTGYFKWRIRRHFKPRVFNRLSSRILACYGDALGVSVKQLCTLPPAGQNCD